MVEKEKLQELESRLPLPDWKWLEAAVNWDAPDLDTITTEQVHQYFASQTHPGAVNDAYLIRSLIWQAWIKIIAVVPDHEPLEGNLRTCWYSIVGPFYRKHQLLPKALDMAPASPEQELLIAPLPDTFISAPESVILGKRSPKDQVIETMTELISDFILHHVFRFQDEFEFQEPIESHRFAGRDRARYFFFTEKDGMWALCKILYDQLDDNGQPKKSLSVMNSKGQPSLITLEYFARSLAAKTKSLIIGAFSDYDPWGYSIAQSLDDKLRFLGFSVKTYYLTTLDLFTPESIEEGVDFSGATGRLKTLVDRWLARTGGVDGRPIGLHIDLIAKARRKERAMQFYQAAAASQLELDYPLIEPLAEKERRWKTPCVLP